MLLLLACATPPTDENDTLPTDKDTGETTPLTFCARLRGGAVGGRDPAVELAEAHGRLRFFGPDNKASETDGRLAAALLTAPPSDDPALLQAYLGDSAETCLVPPETALDPADVTRTDAGLAWVTPGTGTLTLPDDVSGVVLDLRTLPAGTATDTAIRAALAAASASAIVLPEISRRAWDGSVDQLFSSSNSYYVGIDTEAETMAGTGAADLPLYLVTGDVMAPEAAKWAALLRAAGRAAIVGADVDAALGELEWVPVGAEGIAYHARDLDVVDVVPADVATASPEEAFADGAPMVTLTTLTGENTRDPLNARRPWSDDETVPFDTGAARAALLTVHGAMRLFFNYFDVVGDGTDARLLEVLDGVEGDDETAFVERLGRYGEVLHDGHCFFGNLGDDSVLGYAPVKLDHLGGVPVVQRSGDPEIAPGDTLVAIDGEPIADLEAALRSWNGAATEGYTLDFVARQLVYMRDATQVWTLRAVDGTERDVTVSAGAYDATLWYESDQESGLIDGDIAYVNLDSAFTTDVSQITTLLDAAPAGVILDMRGYPGVNIYDVPTLFTTETWLSPYFNVPQRTVDTAAYEGDQYSFDGSADAYTGPIVLLVGPHSVSAAENLSQSLVTLPNVTVVGRQSAGTNGNITGLWLPGGSYFTWTGMQVLNPDGSRFHGVGIVPDVEVEPTPTSYADGVDTTIDAAIAVLRGGA